MLKYLTPVKCKILIVIGISCFCLACFGHLMDQSSCKKRHFNIKQCAFISFILPKIRHANDKVLQLRRRLKDICDADTASFRQRDRKWLTELANRYQYRFHFSEKTISCIHLLKRVDQIPHAIILAQAIQESGWGQSRFARLGHNFFGEWCYRKNCGIKPLRHSLPYHEVAIFSSPQASVDHYVHNINTNPAYRQFRLLRYRDRQLNKPLNVETLLPSLRAYSALGQEYIRRIGLTIKHYRLEDIK